MSRGPFPSTRLEILRRNQHCKGQTGTTSKKENATGCCSPLVGSPWLSASKAEVVQTTTVSALSQNDHGVMARQIVKIVGYEVEQARSQARAQSLCPRLCGNHRFFVVALFSPQLGLRSQSRSKTEGMCTQYTERWHCGEEHFVSFSNTNLELPDHGLRSPG